MLRLAKVQALVLISVVLLSSVAAWAAPERRYVKLTILHTNDTHSHLLPFSYPSSGEMKLPAYRNVGGIARRATLIKRIRAERGADVLVVDAGDVIDGSPFSVEFAGKADFAALNAVGYDAIVTGNHEYSNTFAEFKKRLQEARFPVLGANVFQQDGSPLLTPYIIRTEEGLRVAILGLVIPNNYNAVSQGHLTIKDPEAVAAEWVPKLRGMADAIILLDHIGYDEDRRLAGKVDGIDLIVGGHSHTRVPKPVLVRKDSEPRAFWVGGTVVVQDFQWGSELGRVDLIFRKGNSGWSLMSYHGGLIPVTSDTPEDPAVRQVVESYHKKIAAKYDPVIGEATADFTGEAPINMVSDAMREIYHTDFGIQNYGGVRTDLAQGPITVGDIAMLYPFSDTDVTFSVTGAELKRLLLHTTPAVSNIRYQVKGGKLISAELGGRPIEDTKTYTGATHTFFAGNAMPGIETTDTGIKTRDMIIAYIKRQKTIQPDGERRAIF